MCRVFLTAAIKTLPRKNIKMLRRFGKLSDTGSSLIGDEGHKHGWGIVSYPPIHIDSTPNVAGKNLASANSDPDFNNMLQTLEAQQLKTLVGHLRNSYIGELNDKNNLQPFVFDSWTACHNGNIYNYGNIPLSFSEIIEIRGSTDSEWFLSYLVSKTKHLAGPEILDRLSKLIKTVHAKTNWLSLSFALTNGKAAIVYTDYNIKKSAEYKGRSLSEHFSLYFQINKQWSSKEKNVVICSEPLTAEGSWMRITPFNLYYFNLQTINIDRQVSIT